MESKSLLDYEHLMDKADPDNTGRALNLITYDKEKGKDIFQSSCIFVSIGF